VTPDLLTRADASTGAMGFQTTQWSEVLAARAPEDTRSREAVARLCATYWHPLYAFIRRQGASPQDAEDLTQEFFRRFLERRPLANVHPGGGKFRSFLLACLKNFLANERARTQARRRGGGWRVIPLESGEAENRYALGPVDHLSPEALYDKRWAFAALERTLAELRREYSANDKRHQFEELQGFLPGGEGCVSRAELAVKRGVSIGAIDVAVHRLRQRFGALLRAQIAQTVGSEEEVEEELRYLISVLSG
jgi:DNA-directed RNA polymerase specialized sigma24 family protein